MSTSSETTIIKRAGVINRRRSSSLTSDAILPWDRFHCWIHCICVVTFDLEIGQTLEVVLPRHTKLTEREKTNICYLAFPDSNSGCLGDTKFHFRIRSQTHPDCKTVEFYTKYNKSAPVALCIDSSCFYGFVYFRQVRDKTLPRGYLQKSLVIVTKFPFVNLFSQIVDRLAPGFFGAGLPILEAACDEMDRWAQPRPGATLNLPLMGTLFQVRLPSKFDKYDSSADIYLQINERNSNSTTIIVPSVNEPNFFEYLCPLLPHLGLLWELVLVGEPLAVMALSPNICSNVIHCLINLITPLRYCQDYRPFFTIHDSEFKEFTTTHCLPPKVLIGVTNPFFAKTLENWSNVIRIGESMTSSPSKSSPVAKHKVKRNGDLKTLDSKPGIYSKYKPFLQNDKTLLKRLMKGIESRRPSEVQSAIIRRHFFEITQSFLIPLERYLASLMPLQRNISPWKDTPKMSDFDFEDFLVSLDTAGPQLTSYVKGDWLGLYRQFFSSANYLGWLKYRQREINYKLQMLHLEIFCSSPIADAVNGKREVELVDMVLKIREKLKFIDENIDRISCHLRTKLLKHQETVLSTLSDDLRLVLADNKSIIGQQNIKENLRLSITE